MSPLGHVPPMEEHLTAIRGADEPVPLPTYDLHNPPQRRPTARIWLAIFARTLRLGASRARRRWLVAHPRAGPSRFRRTTSTPRRLFKTRRKPLSWQTIT